MENENPKRQPMLLEKIPTNWRQQMPTHFWEKGKLKFEKPLGITLFIRQQIWPIIVQLFCQLPTNNLVVIRRYCPQCVKQTFAQSPTNKYDT